jgi:8-oxo-dGTP pyrophosphatase MutT (NUDIX family)
VEKVVIREAKEELSLTVEPMGDILTIVFIGIVSRADARGGDDSEEG